MIDLLRRDLVFAIRTHREGLTNEVRKGADRHELRTSVVQGQREAPGTLTPIRNRCVQAVM